MSETPAVDTENDITIETEALDQEPKIDEEGEVEIVLADHEPSLESKPDPRSHILARMTRRDSKQQDRINELETQLRTAAQPVQPLAEDPFPTLESCEHDEGLYAQRQGEWHRRNMESVTASHFQQQQHGHNLTAQTQRKEQSLSQYAEHAAKLGVSDFNETQDKAMDVLGDEFCQMLAEALPEESPKLMYWFGKNPLEAARYRDKYAANGPTTTFALGQLSAKLTVKRKTSTAADPERTIEAGGLASSEGDFKKAFDAIYTKVDDDKLTTAQAINEVRALKKQAKAAGYDVSLLR